MIGNDYKYDIKSGNSRRSVEQSLTSLHHLSLNKVRAETSLEFYKSQVPVLPYGCELWTETKKQKNKIKAL